MQNLKLFSPCNNLDILLLKLKFSYQVKILQNISKLIWDRISNHFPFDEILEEYEINELDVLDEIEDILSDIL